MKAPEEHETAAEVRRIISGTLSVAGVGDEYVLNVARAAALHISELNAYMLPLEEANRRGYRFERSIPEARLQAVIMAAMDKIEAAVTAFGTVENMVAAAHGCRDATACAAREGAALVERAEKAEDAAEEAMATLRLIAAEFPTSRSGSNVVKLVQGACRRAAMVGDIKAAEAALTGVRKKAAHALRVFGLVPEGLASTVDALRVARRQAKMARAEVRRVIAQEGGE